MATVYLPLSLLIFATWKFIIFKKCIPNNIPSMQHYIFVTIQCVPSQQCACRFGCRSFSFLENLFSGDICDLLFATDTTDSFFLALLGDFGEVNEPRRPWGDGLLPGERVCFFLAGSRCEVEWRGDRCGDFLAIFSVAFLLASSSEAVEFKLSDDAKDDSLLSADGRNGGVNRDL